ncbi:MAG: class I SAM-dependent methyltransferase [Spirochaetota bacterium]
MTNKKYDDKIAYFNNLSANWDEVVGNDQLRIQELRNVFSLINIKPNDTVMDVGCGTGVLFTIIQERIGPQGTLIAVDPSDRMIEEAKKRYANFNNITYIVGPLEDITLPDKSINVILCFAVFPHIEDKQMALKKCYNFLTVDGSLYIFHLSDTKSLNEFHHNLNAPVSRDYMPIRKELEEMIRKTGFILMQYIDEPELNFIHIKLQ